MTPSSSSLITKTLKETTHRQREWKKKDVNQGGKSSFNEIVSLAGQILSRECPGTLKKSQGLSTLGLQCLVLLPRNFMDGIKSRHWCAQLLDNHRENYFNKKENHLTKQGKKQTTTPIQTTCYSMKSAGSPPLTPVILTPQATEWRKPSVQPLKWTLPGEMERSLKTIHCLGSFTYKIRKRKEREECKMSCELVYTFQYFLQGVIHACPYTAGLFRIDPCCSMYQ